MCGSLRRYYELMKRQENKDTNDGVDSNQCLTNV